MLDRWIAREVVYRVTFITIFLAAITIPDGILFRNFRCGGSALSISTELL